MAICFAVVFALILLAGEASVASGSPDVARCVLALGLVTLSPMILAALQVLQFRQWLHYGTRDSANVERVLKQADRVHFVAWSMASLSGVWLMKWPAAVRSGLAPLEPILIDELLIILPATISLLGSWFIFAHLEQMLEAKPNVSNLKLDFKNAAGYVGLKTRHELAIGLIPLLTLFGIKDVTAFLPVAGSTGVLLASLLGLVVCLLGFPLLLRYLWPSAPYVVPMEGFGNVAGEAIEPSMRNVRVLQTGGRMYNAVVAGFVPGMQTVFVSDGLVKHFPINEVDAVVRHEWAHARRHHALIRLLAITAPFVSILILDGCGFAIVNQLESFARHSQIGLVAISLTAFLLTACYLFFVIRPLSHWIEFDADLRSIGDPCEKFATDSDWKRAQDLSDALSRLGVVFPDLRDRATFFHPSLDERRKRLTFVSKDPGQLRLGPNNRNADQDN